MLSQSTTDSDERRQTQQPCTPSSSSSAGTRHKFRLLSSLPRAFFSFDPRAMTKRRSSADTSSNAAVAAGNDDVDTAAAHRQKRLVADLDANNTGINQINK